MQMRILTIALVSLLIAFPAWADPAIPEGGVSGTISHGETVTIAGTGFGTHSDHNNLSDTWQGRSAGRSAPARAAVYECTG